MAWKTLSLRFFLPGTGLIWTKNTEWTGQIWYIYSQTEHFTIMLLNVICFYIYLRFIRTTIAKLNVTPTRSLFNHISYNQLVQPLIRYKHFWWYYFKITRLHRLQNHFFYFFCLDINRNLKFITGNYHPFVYL